MNADEFARAISPGDPDSVAFAAGRRMLERMRELIASKKSFGLETTLSGKSYLPLLKKCKKAGWRVILVYLWLPSPEAAIRRVELRVRKGGHSVPADIIRRRYHNGVANLFNFYRPLADELEIYDNSVNRVRIANRSEGGIIVVRDAKRWAKLKRISLCGQ